MHLAARKFPLRWLTACLLSVTAFSFVGPVVAQQLEQAPPPEVLPAQPVQSALPARALTLDECVAVGLQRQPAVLAARATLASAETNAAALSKLCLASLIARDLPIRCQQADLGVQIAQAGLAQVEWETVYAVRRCYWGWVYATTQQKLVKDLIANLTDSYLATAQGLAKIPISEITQADADNLEVEIQLARQRELQANAGVERALAALREAMGLDPCGPLELTVLSLPEGMELPCKGDLLTLALSRRGELIQAGLAAQVVDLEAEAQARITGLTGRTFAAGSDIHSRPIPQGISNREYRPGAVGLEMPTLLAGHQHDRVQRARDLGVRAGAVVEKTRGLISLEVEDGYLKWQEATRRVQLLQPVRKKAQSVQEAFATRWRGLDKKTKQALQDAVRAENQAVSVRSQYVEAQYELALALAAIERITAGGTHAVAGAAPTPAKQEAGR